MYKNEDGGQHRFDPTPSYSKKTMQSHRPFSLIMPSLALASSDLDDVIEWAGQDMFHSCGWVPHLRAGVPSPVVQG